MTTYLKYNIIDKYVEFPEPLDPALYNNIGETYDDYIDGLWVPLSEEQLKFREENPNATVREVFYMELATPSVIERTVEIAKMDARNAINTYDSSEEVNIFYIQGISVWLDKATRAGLKLRFEAELAVGQENTTLWYNNIQFPLPVQSAMQMLYAIEIYASACYDNTQRHLAAIESLETVEEIDNYDYKTGYPEKLNF